MPEMITITSLGVYERLQNYVLAIGVEVMSVNGMVEHLL